MARLRLEEVMYFIQQAKVNSPETNLDEEKVKEYINKELNKDQRISKDDQTARQIADLMERNPVVKRELKESLPVANAIRKEKMAKLRTDAARTGMDKLKNDFRGIKKRAAQRELREIANAKNKSVGGKELRSDIANNSISTGRGRTILTAAVNYFSLGSYDERHPKNVAFQKEHKTGDITCNTPDGILKGALYEPKPENKTGKVVIFFSGSGGAAEDYSKGVIDEYIKSGASVVTMNYRGFGESVTCNKNGEKLGTPLSENSLYKDGHEMLKYVLNTMKVKPEDIILHGYSMGGAVASKVAADFAQTQQKNALEKGKTVKKLGGVVLHSPMPTLREASSGVIKSAMEDIPVVGPILGSAIGAIVGQGSHDFAGAYNTRSHMRRLHKFDPDIPVHYVSGQQAVGDDLDINATRIHLDPQAHFTNSSTHIGNNDHEGKNLSTDNEGLNNMLKNTRQDIKPTKPAPVSRNPVGPGR